VVIDVTRILATLEEKQALWQQLEENDDATLERHCDLWEAKRGVRVSPSAMRAGKALRGVDCSLAWLCAYDTKRQLEASCT